jgi:coenzyme F420 hydrogenase subunit delta
MEKEDSGGKGYPLPGHLACRVLVLGVGNRLYGDDAFGPRLIERLEEHREELPEGTCLPEGVCLIDAGTGAARLLFDLLVAERRPERLYILDAVDLPGRAPGEVFELTPAELPGNKRDDFSLHQLPGSNLLAELERAGCPVRVIGCQVKEVPAQMREGLSPEVEAALGPAADLLLARLRASA